MKIRVMTAQQRMIERNSHAAVAVLDIEHHGVPANFTPVPDDLYPAIACRHESSEINRPHFKVALNWNRLLHDRRRQESGDDQGLTRLQKSAVEIRVGLADCFAQFAGSQE